MALQILPALPHLVEAAEGVTIDVPVVAYVGVDNGAVVGSFGLAWGRGRCWIWLRVAEINARYGITIMHRAKRLFAKARQLGETEVFTPRDANYPTSEKLLKVLGFTLHSIENGIEVWHVGV